MPQAHKISSFILIALLFLLPIFFIPGDAVSIGVAKSFILGLGVVVATLVFLLEVWQKGELTIPWHLLLLAVIVLPLVYFVSAYLSTPSALSLFGYNFEVGTFGFMLLVSILLILISLIFTDTSKLLKASSAFFVSISLVAVFTTIKILFGGSPIWGIFTTTTSNPIGRWTDLGIAFGLLSVFSILALGVIPMKKPLRLLTYVVFWLSTALLAVINFSTAFILTLVSSVLLVIYFSTIEKRFSGAMSQEQEPMSENSHNKSNILPVVLGIISIVFLINPNISATKGTLGEVVTSVFNIENTEIRPSFSATLSISKAALSQNILLGSGPNTFDRDWLIHKPVEVNTTPFWGVAFPFGVGFIPTQISATGVLGIIAWFSFLILLIVLGVKSLANVPESRALRFIVISSLFFFFYLWIASFLYVPSLVMLTLAFAFSGFFLAAIRQSNVLRSRTILFSQTTTTNLISTVLISVFVLGTITLGLVTLQKTTSAFYFKKAIDLSNTTGVSLEEVESALNGATKFAPADIHYVALSRIYFAKAQAAAANTENTQEVNLAAFEDSISKSILSARQAADINPAGYQNWIALGAIYSYLVPAPLNVAGAYENAVLAYAEASKKNPLNPEIPLFAARLEINHGDMEAARSLIRQSLVLKEDYADAYLMLAQLEVQQNNIAEAIVSADRLALLVPNNPAIFFELGLLKYSNKDYNGAAIAFSSALNTTPDYANAQYYLGLSLAQLGLLDDSKRQFEALLKTNPDNEEVKLILQELEAGKVTFLGGSTK